MKTYFLDNNKVLNVDEVENFDNVEETTIADLADTYGLNYDESTESGNGYPTNLKHFLHGFSDWNDLQEIAEETGLTPYVFKIKNGWSLYARHSQALEPFNYCSALLGDNYNDISAHSDDFFENEFKHVVNDALENCYGFDDLQIVKDLINKYEQLNEQLSEYDENDYLIFDTQNREIIGKVENESLSYSDNDVSNYLIGLIKL